MPISRKSVAIRRQQVRQKKLRNFEAQFARTRRKMTFGQFSAAIGRLRKLKGIKGSKRLSPEEDEAIYQFQERIDDIWNRMLRLEEKGGDKNALSFRVLIAREKKIIQERKSYEDWLRKLGRRI